MAAVTKELSPVIRAIGKLGGPLQAARILGGGATLAKVNWWWVRDHVPPEHVGDLARCAGLSVEEFAEHEKQKYLALAEASRSAVPR